MSTFEHIRTAVITLLRAESVEFDPPPRKLARSALTRRIERLEMRASGVPIEDTDVLLARLDLVAEDVRVRFSLRGPVLDVGETTFAATLTQDQLSTLVPLPPGVDRLSVTRRGFTFHTVAGIPIYTSVSLNDSKIVVAPSAPAKVPLLDLIGIDIEMPQLPVRSGLEQLTRFGLSFDLPELPANATIERLQLRDGHVVVSGTAELSGGDAGE
ncbi:LmeA family phospholipid-binding protein [Haloechinothrix halophila]|uniref:LmeA family phospholipid-binding protein n=1 Tax=Haloechinothrix halophila TaxID=1069073 RepID=UPI000415269C|nr:LmeA family phospholipid-binding protein [Haloechinothrix halophila]